MSLVEKIVGGLGGGVLLRARHRRRLLVLMWHGLVEQPLDPPCWHMTTQRTFARQLRWIRRRFRPVPLEPALEHLVAGTLPARACAVTFDDGYASTRSLALPVLEALRVPATVFLTTDHVDSDLPLWPDRIHLAFTRTSARAVDASALGLGTLPLDGDAARQRAIARVVAAFKTTPVPAWPEAARRILRSIDRTADEDPGPFRCLTWADVEAMQAGGLVTFASHTRAHPILAQCEDAALVEQIRTAHRIVTARTGREPKVFAYPNGRREDFDERARLAVRRLDIPFALTTEPGRAARTVDPLAVPRVAVGSDLTFDRFRLLASGLARRRR